MSRRRKPSRQPWKPWTAPDTQTLPAAEPPDCRVRVDVCGFDAGVLAAVDTLRANGALRIRYGWNADVAELAEDAPVGLVVVWWFEVTAADGSVVRGEAAPTSDHGRGVLEAASVILRGNGVQVGPS